MRSKLNSADQSSLVQQPIIFQYGSGDFDGNDTGTSNPRCNGDLLLMPFPLLLSRPLSVGMKLDALFVGGLGIAFGWVLVVAVQCWHSYLTVYEVNRDGIKARLGSVVTFNSWDHLKSARYRRSLGQIDIEFTGESRRVVLNNVDMNMQRRRVLSAFALIEEIAPTRVRRSFF